MESGLQPPAPLWRRRIVVLSLWYVLWYVRVDNRRVIDSVVAELVGTYAVDCCWRRPCSKYVFLEMERDESSLEFIQGKNFFEAAGVREGEVSTGLPCALSFIDIAAAGIGIAADTLEIVEEFP